MRNLRSAGLWIARAVVGASLVAGVVGSGPAGCAPVDGADAGAAVKPKTPLKPKELTQAVQDAYAAFGRRQFAEAMAGADRVLASNPQGQGAAEAQYIRGRVFEQRAIEAANDKSIGAAKAALQSARDAYNAALTQAPVAMLEGNIRAGIANVSYYMEEYPAAIAQGMAAYNKLTDAQARAWVLYRVGLSQQRSGNFPQADRTFAAVQQEFPNTEQSRRAAAHQGARGFHIQVGTFSSAANADGALADLRSQGVIGLSLPNPAGQHVVRVGPAPTYEQAKAMKARVAGKYPDALIIP